MDSRFFTSKFLDNNSQSLELLYTSLLHKKFRFRNSQKNTNIRHSAIFQQHRCKLWLHWNIKNSATFLAATFLQILLHFITFIITIANISNYQKLIFCVNFDPISLLNYFLQLELMGSSWVKAIDLCISILYSLTVNILISRIFTLCNWKIS